LDDPAGEVGASEERQELRELSFPTRSVSRLTQGVDSLMLRTHMILLSSRWAVLLVGGARALNPLQPRLHVGIHPIYPHIIINVD
jgi:hypothetical protein